MMAGREIWSVTRLGSKLSASISPNGGEIAIGITNTIARTGVANSVSFEEATELATAIVETIASCAATDPGDLRLRAMGAINQRLAFDCAQGDGVSISELQQHLKETHSLDVSAEFANKMVRGAGWLRSKQASGGFRWFPRKPDVVDLAAQGRLA